MSAEKSETPDAASIDVAALRSILAKAGSVGLEKRALLEAAGFPEASYRTSRVVARALSEARVFTTPPFAEAFAEDRLRLLESNAGTRPAAESQRRTEGNRSEPPALTHNPAARISEQPAPSNQDVARHLTLGQIAKPFRAEVTSGATVSAAATAMIREGQGFCVIRKSAREIHGVANWADLANALITGRSSKLSPVTSVMRTDVPQRLDTVSLFDAMSLLTEHPAIIVTSPASGVVGAVTTHDMIASLHDLTTPFLLLSRIESQLRTLIDASFSLEDIRLAKDTRDSRRVVNGAGDLTFGEYLRLLEDTENWNRSPLKGHDRAIVINWMRQINDTRNDVMHFRTSRLGTEDRLYLERFDTFLRELL